jgi:hypothetical protein
MRFILFLFFIYIHLTTQAQETASPATDPWKIGAVTGLQFSATRLNDAWNAGGASQIASTTNLEIFGNYKKGRVTWNNDANFLLGGVKQEEDDWVKTTDLIHINLKFGYQLHEKKNKMFLTSLLDFRTQFLPGFDQGGRGKKISEFMAPGFAVLAAGFDYRPAEYFSLSYSPVSAKLTFVMDDTLSARGAFGVNQGETFRAEAGSFAKLNFASQVVTNVVLASDLTLFTNYLENFGNIDVNWINNFSFKVNNLLSASIILHLIYDDDIDYVFRDEATGEEVNAGPRTQFKQVFGFGLAYRGGDKK